MFVQKAGFLGLFWGELIFEGAYYWREFCVSNWAELDNKLEQLETLRKQPTRTAHGLVFGRAYYRKDICA